MLIWEVDEADLQIKVGNWILFLFLNQNICCRYSKEPSPGLQIRMHTEKLFFFFLNQNICCGTQKNRLNEVFWATKTHV